MPVTLNASTSSGFIATSDTSGSLELQANGATKATVGSTGLSIGQYNPSASLITSRTAQASTSGTFIDFTGIPSWVKRITVMLQGVSTNGTAYWALRVGTSAGVAATGYAGGAGEVFVTNSTGTNGSSTEIPLQATVPAAAEVNNGVVQIVNLTGNTWAFSGTLYRSGGAASKATMTAGTVALSGTLDRVRLTTTNGTDAFDAGSINILYE